MPTIIPPTESDICGIGATPTKTSARESFRQWIQAYLNLVGTSGTTDGALTTLGGGAVGIDVLKSIDTTESATALGLSADTGAGLIGHIDSAVGAVATTVTAKLREMPSIQDFPNQAAIDASGRNWLFMPEANSLTVAGALAKNYWGPGDVALVSGDTVGTQGGAEYGFLVVETVTAGSGQHFAFGAKAFTGTRTDGGSAPGQNHIVGGYFEAQRGAGSSDGIWSMNTLVDAYNLSGPTIGLEIDMNNLSGADPGLSPAQVYHGLSIISGATGRGSTAFVIDRNGDHAANHWHRGIHIKEVLTRGIEFTNSAAATGIWTDAVFQFKGTSVSSDSLVKLIPFDDTDQSAALFYLANAADSVSRAEWLKRGEIAINSADGKGTSGLSIKGIANGDNLIFLQRTTDTGPTGTFMRFVNAANSAVLFDVDMESSVDTTNVSLSVGGASATRVYVGAADSGGTGYRMLRVAN